MIGRRKKMTDEGKIVPDYCTRFIFPDLFPKKSRTTDAGDQRLFIRNLPQTPTRRHITRLLPIGRLMPYLVANLFPQMLLATPIPRAENSLCVRVRLDKLLSGPGRLPARPPLLGSHPARHRHVRHLLREHAVALSARS